MIREKNSSRKTIPPLVQRIEVGADEDLDDVLNHHVSARPVATEITPSMLKSRTERLEKIAEKWKTKKISN